MVRSLMGKSYDQEYIKKRTNEIYDALPMDKEQRIACLKERDEIIDLNYTYFGYIANSTYVDNASYEDKFQTAIMSFLGMWWKYKWTPKYRADLSFGVFFKPRLSEEVRRYLTSVPYTTKRTVYSKVAKLLGKPWTEITYDDLSKVQLPAKDMLAVQAVLGASAPADLADCELYLHAIMPDTIDKYQTTAYDSIEELLIQETIDAESKLTNVQLHKIAEMYSLDYSELKALYPKAMETLYKRLHDAL